MTQHAEPAVSILIVSYNTAAMTLACLDTITCADATEIIVVDNASTDGSADAIREHHGDAHLIALTENIGFARANNLAARHARGRYILLLNPDTEIKPGAIDRLLAFARTNPDARIWGGRTTFADGSLNATSCFADTTVWSLFARVTGLSALAPSSETLNPETYGRWQRDVDRDVDIVTGCFLLIERAFWRQLGGFDETFFMFGEEVDLCLRARDLGARPRVTATSEIIHHGGASEPARADRMVKVLTAKVALIDRHWPAWKRPFGKTLLALWPATRWLALAAMARMTGSAIRAARADVWADIVGRRETWKAGYPARSRAIQATPTVRQEQSPSANPARSTTSEIKTPRAPEISVIIPHLDDVTRLKACLAALRRQTLPAQKFEIVICDNGSACGLHEVWQAAAGATVVTTDDRGAAPARNCAIAASKGKALAFIDSDCLPDENWLSAGLDALQHYDLAGGAVTVTAKNPDKPNGIEAFEQVFAFDNARYVDQEGFSVTANLFAKRTVFDAIGGFRNGVPEDLDWCRRATRAGFRLGYTPTAIVSHPARQSLPELAAKWNRLTNEAFVQWRTTGGTRLGWLLRAGAVLLSPTVHVARIITSNRIAGTAVRARAAATLFNIRTRRAVAMIRLLTPRTHATSHLGTAHAGPAKPNASAPFAAPAALPTPDRT